MTPEDLPALPEPDRARDFQPSAKVYAAYSVPAIQRTAYEAGQRSDVVRQMAQALDAAQEVLDSLPPWSAAQEVLDSLPPWSAAGNEASMVRAALRAYRKQTK